jgi:uncharacterized protein YuzE
VKFQYYPETDSLYIDLAEKTSIDSQEVAPGVVLDFDKKLRIFAASPRDVANERCLW